MLWKVTRDVIHRCLNLFGRGLKILFRVKMLPVSSSTDLFVIELKRACRRLSVLQNDNWWRRNANRLRSLILNDDVTEFLTWDVITKTMFGGNTPYILIEFIALWLRADWKERWKSVLKESESGHPIPFFVYPQSSGGTIHSAYHLMKFEQYTGKKIDDFKVIFDFGGGYGNMRKVAHGLGFKGKYIIYDFPVFSALQKFYLRSVGVSVLCISDINELRSVLKRYTDESNSLFIATWSISETPLYIRHQILSLVDNFGAYLIAFQKSFDETNNDVFFADWRKDGTRRRVDWQSWKIRHLPGNRYLTGTRSFV